MHWEAVTCRLSVREVVHSEVPLHHSSLPLLNFSSQSSIFSCPLFSAVLKQFEHHSFTSPLQTALIILHFIPSYSFSSPEKLRQSHCLVCSPCPPRQYSCQRRRLTGSREGESIGEPLALWDHSGKSWFKISVDDRQFRDTWQFYHSRAHCNFTAYMVHVLAFYWCLSASPPSATVTRMQWLQSQSYFALILSLSHTTSRWKSSKEECHLFILSPRKYWQRLHVLRTLNSTGLWVFHWVEFSSQMNFFFLET